jgi:TolA-binding protein
MSDRASCPRFVEIGRSLSPEDVPELRLHLDECLYCQSQWAATRRLIETIRQHPTQAPEATRRQQTRDALLLATTELRRRRVSPRWAQAAVYAAVGLGAAGVLAAVGTIAIPWLHKQREATPAATDRDYGRPHAKASFKPQAETETVSPPETGASLAASVAPTKPSGAVSPESLVPRSHGTSLGRQATTRKPQAALASVSLTSPSPNPTHRPSPAELAFSEGWQAFRSGDYPRAAVAMSRAVEAAPTAALAEDAGYWEAVALARQRSVAKARKSMEEFLRLFPGSPRAGEVSAMLGWLLVDAHEWPAAERRFRSAESDRAPAVRESAKKGLEITARLRERPKTAQ